MENGSGRNASGRFSFCPDGETRAGLLFAQGNGFAVPAFLSQANLWRITMIDNRDPNRDQHGNVIQPNPNTPMNEMQRAEEAKRKAAADKAAADKANPNPNPNPNQLKPGQGPDDLRRQKEEEAKREAAAEKARVDQSR